VIVLHLGGDGRAPRALVSGRDLLDSQRLERIAGGLLASALDQLAADPA